LDEGYGLEKMGPRLSISNAYTHTISDAISRFEYDPSVNQTAESYFMMKVNKNSKCSQRQNWVAVSKHWCKLKVDTNKHEDLNLMIANHRKEDKIHPLMKKCTL
jgi:hypothetical protein